MAKQGFFSEHWNDEDDNPGGGVATGRGFTISWQNGPLGKEGTPERSEPNGAFVEDIIDVAADRIAYYQASKYACEENAEALKYLQKANEVLDSRTKDRKQRGVEGTHQE